MLDAAVRRVPITGDIEHVTAPEGASVAEFVAIAFPAEAHRAHVVAIVDGEEIAADAWDRVPRAGEALQLVFRPGGKDFFRTILQIAVIAVAAWVGFGGLGGWFAAGMWQTAVAAAGVSILGSLAINALIPLPKPATIEAPPPYYSLSSARNAARLWSPVPMLFGRQRIVAPRMSDPFQEVLGGVTYLRVALCLGLCPMQVSDWKIGETALSSFTGVEMEVRLNADDPPHTLITGDPVQDAVGATLTNADWTERTTATDVDEIECVFDFASGLGGLDSKGRKTARTVNIRVEYRPTGSSDPWTEYRPTVPQANSASAGAGAAWRGEYFDFQPDLSGWETGLDGLGGVANGPLEVTRSDPGRAFRVSARFAVPRGQYDVRCQRVAAASTDPNIVDAVQWGVLGSIRTAADPFPNRKLATACFRIKATDQLSNMVDTLNCIADSLQPVFSAEALADPTIADAGEFTDVDTSSNPAVLALLAMRGPNTAYPKPDEEVDWVSFATAAAKFAERGLTFNEYVESDIGRWEMVNRILAAGHARAVKHNGRVSVVVDDSKAGQAPAQTFTPRNVLNFRWQKTYPRLPHAIRTPFANAANGWQADEVTVFLPNPAGGTYTAETATRYETVAMPGKTDADEIRTVVNQYARNSYFQTESFEFETDVEHLAVKRGDYCVVQHHAMATGLGAARIASREVNGGGDVTAIVLDADVETPVGESLAVQWRTIVADSGLARMEVIGEQAVTRDAANPRRFVFATPQSGSTKPAARGADYEGDIALVGIAGKVSFEVLIRDIQPRPHLRAAISCVAYAGERFVDAPDWPAHDPKVTRAYAPRPTAPTNAVPIASTLQIAVGFTQPAMPIGVELTGYRVARRESGSTGDSWEPLGPLGPDERIAIAPAGEPGADYDIRIIAVGVRDDGVTVYSDALIAAAVSAVTAPAAPAGCGGAFSTRTSSGGAQQLVLTATWTANENPDVLDTVVEQRVSTGPDVWQEIGRGAAAAGRTEIHGLPVGRAYLLRFINISKRGAPSTPTTISSITAPDTLVATGALAAVPGSALAVAIAGAGASAGADAAAAAASAAAAAAAQALAEAARDTATSAAGSAGTYSGEAQDARDDAVAAAAVAGTHADTADAHAATALAQASSATASASAAASSATLSATFAAGSQGSINSSATFADNANATGVPTNWVDWADGSACIRVTGLAPQPYAVKIRGVAGYDGGVQQSVLGRLTTGWQVLEADITLVSGSLAGAGVHLNTDGSGGGVSLTFSTDLDTSGSAPGAGTVGRLYRFRKLVQISAGTTYNLLYAMSHWTGHGSVASANEITWHRCAVRPASQAEIEARQAKLDLVTTNANVDSNTSAIAAANGSIASLTTTVSSNHTAVMAPSVNLIPYPSGTARTNPTGEGLSTTQQGWTVSGGSAGGGFVNGYWDPAGGAILYNMWAAGYSSGSDRYYYIDIPVTYWGWYTFAFDGYVSNLDATKVSYYVQALNGSNTWLGESATTAFSASPNGRRSVTFNAPSGTEKLRVAFRIQAHTSPSAGAYADLVMRALQLEHGQVATKFNEAGRIIAGERRIGLAEAEIAVTALTLATESAARALLETNLRAALGAGSDNLVINTDFYNGLEGWVTGWDGNSGLPVTRGFADTDSVGGSAGAYSGAVRTAYVRLVGTPAADTVVDGYTTRQWANLADLKRWAVRVPGAVRVHASMYMSAHRGKARLIVGEFDAAGTLITDANAWDGTANHNNFGSGNPANAERVGGFFTTNANTRYLVLIPRLVGVSGGNDPYLFYGWAMVAMASAQQTVAAPYVSGGLDRGIYGDVALNAGAIADVNGGAAWLEAVVSASGGDLGAFRLRAGKAGSFIELISTVLRLANVSNGAVIEVMRAIGGFAFFSNPVSIDVGGQRLTLGPGFGASSDLLFWFGPGTTAISAMTKTNGHWAWATDGGTYKGTGALVDSTVNEQTKTGTAAFDNVTTSGTTVHTMATVDLTVGASGYLELLSPLFYGPLSINQESGMTLSAGTDWFGQMIVTEQLQSGGTEYTLWTIPLQISDTGGGLFDFIFDPPVVKVVAQNVSGASRYRLKLQRTSGSNNVSGNGLQGKFTIRRTP